MGAVFLTFAIYTTRDGRMAVESYDRIAKVMDVHTEPFTVRYKEKVMELKRLLMTYVKDLRQQRLANHETCGVSRTAGDYEVRLTDSGYPLLPTNDQLDNLRKGELDAILRSYLTCHYSEYSFIRIA